MVGSNNFTLHSLEIIRYKGGQKCIFDIQYFAFEMLMWWNGDQVSLGKRYLNENDINLFNCGKYVS